MPYLVGDLVAPFTFPAAGEGGHRVQLQPYAAAATAVVWTCNHCPYALAWHDRIQDVARDYASRGVIMLQINANDGRKYPDDAFTVMTQRVMAGDFASPYLHDSDQEVSKEWGAKVTPDVFVLDRDGRIVYRGAPDSDYDNPSLNAAYLRAALDDVLSGSPVRTPETKPMGCKIKWTTDDQPNPYV